MSATISSRDMATAITDAAHRISATADYDDLIELAGPAGFVLIGEASHGTHEFYARRAELTRRLIGRKISGSSHWKPIGPTCCAYIVMSLAEPKGATRRKR